MSGDERNSEIYGRDGGETILVVEDNDQVRALAEIVLSRKGYSVLSAGSGSYALDMLHSSETPVHLLLADLVMPGMGGKDLYSEARKIRRDLKVVYMSGYACDLVMNKKEIESGVHFVQKPFSIEALLDEVRSALDN